MNLHKSKWTNGLTTRKFEELSKKNESTVTDLLKLAKDYNSRVKAEETKSLEELAIENVGKVMTVPSSQEVVLD